jgi:PHD/YefM family antitoxin component YafN of YafNO toxin-antitoxin module
MDITRDIQPLTYFRRKSTEAVKHLKSTRRPMVLTINGKAEVVVQDAASYQRLLDIAAQADAAEGVRQGIEDVREGRTVPARDVFDRMRREYGIPR